ncbi:hypothetical protein ACWGLE_22140 [Streptomyces sp. NPDC055897]
MTLAALDTRFPHHGGPRCAGNTITVEDLFPEAAALRQPFEVVIGERFETATLPRRAALEAIDRLAHVRPHPVGAAVCQDLTDQWTLFLPPGSGFGLRWRWPIVHRQSGRQTLPSYAAGPHDDLRWVRRGNAEHRVFTAPLVLYALAGQLPGPPVGSAVVRLDRTPVEA